jgi:hypothetical protein
LRADTKLHFISALLKSAYKGASPNRSLSYSQFNDIGYLPTYISFHRSSADAPFFLPLPLFAAEAAVPNAGDPLWWSLLMSSSEEDTSSSLLDAIFVV